MRRAARRAKTSTSESGVFVRARRTNVVPRACDDVPAAREPDSRCDMTDEIARPFTRLCFRAADATRDIGLVARMAFATPRSDSVSQCTVHRGLPLYFTCG